MKKIPVMLAILLGFALLFGFVSCDNGTTDDDQFSEYLDSLSSGNPSSATLAAVGLTSSKFGNITGAVATGIYRGYMFDDDDDDDLNLIYTGANRADYEAVKAKVVSELTATAEGEEDDEGFIEIYYLYGGSNAYGCSIYYTKTAQDEGDGLIIPAGFLAVRFRAND
jgi:hypothetical protein